MDAARARRLEDRIAQIVAEMLETRIKDPRLGFVTVTEARLTNDLREATVFYTVFGSPEQQADTAAALASATGVIRSEVGRQTGLRHTPSLAFAADALPDTARHIEDLVDRARQADKDLASATGVIRSEVGRQTGLRHTPSLAFAADALPDNARHIEDLVDRARQADKDLARVREGAVPAGDPDPYRHPAPDEDE